MMRVYIFMLGLAATVLLDSRTAMSAPVGEIHRLTSEPTAALRDSLHRDEVRITVWYPAATNAVEQPLLIGRLTSPCSMSAPSRSAPLLPTIGDAR